MVAGVCLDQSTTGWWRNSTRADGGFPARFRRRLRQPRGSEEDGHAASSAAEVAAGLAAGTLPPFIGIRVKPFNEDIRARSMRTLDIFITALVEKTGGALPRISSSPFPRCRSPRTCTAAATTSGAALEAKLGLDRARLRLELMVETPQSIIDRDGRCPLLGFIEPRRGAAGPCISASMITPHRSASPRRIRRWVTRRATSRAR